MPTAAETAASLTANAHESLPAGALERLLAKATADGRQLRVKLGLDPTAPDIHLGHTVVLSKLRQFQDLGHRVVLIVGDYTARVGDPSGRSQMRPTLSGAEIDANAATYREQAFAVLRDDPELLEVRRNGEWLAMEAEELFALARTTTVAQMLEREDFARRFAAQQPISLLELLYPVLQGYDSVAVRADVELGGTDQTFNLLLGRDVQRSYGLPEQAILTMPLLVGIDGEQKMSKSVGNHIGVTEAPEEQFGKTMSLPDAAMDEWFRLLAIEPAPEGISPRDRKRWLARAIADRFHGEGAGAIAEQHFDRLFVDRGLPDEIDEHPLTGGEQMIHLPALLAEAFGVSRAEARRSLAQGGVKLDGDPLASDSLDVEASLLEGRVLQLGKRRFARLVRAG